MITIGIRKNLKEQIFEQKNENESINKYISRLLENSDEIQPFEGNPRTNIKVSEENFRKLQELKTDGESYGSVILRLINSQ